MTTTPAFRGANAASYLRHDLHRTCTSEVHTWVLSDDHQYLQGSRSQNRQSRSKCSTAASSSTQWYSGESFTRDATQRSSFASRHKGSCALGVLLSSPGREVTHIAAECHFGVFSTRFAPTFAPRLVGATHLRTVVGTHRIYRPDGLAAYAPVSPYRHAPLMAGPNQVEVAGEEVTLLAPDGTLGVEEAAQACGVSDETIRRRLRARQLPNAVRDGGPNGTWRIPLADLVSAGFSPSIGSSADDRSVDIARLRAELDAAARLLAERQARIEELQLHLSDLRSLINSREGR